MADKKLMRSNNKMIAGVCAGVAEYFDADPTVIRAAYVLLFFITGIIPLLIVYFALAVIIPQK